MNVMLRYDCYCYVNKGDGVLCSQHGRSESSSCCSAAQRQAVTLPVVLLSALSLTCTPAGYR